MTQRKIWGLQRNYDITENMLTPAGGKVIYGYGYPSNSHIIQGYAVDYSAYAAEPYLEDIEHAKAQKGILMTLDCEGYGETVEDALHMADHWMYREESRLEVEEIIEKAHPDYTYRIAPSEHSILKKLNKEENYNTRKSLISAAAGEKFKEQLDQFFYKLLEEIDTTVMDPRQINQAYQRLIEGQKKRTTRELLYDHVYTDEIRQLLFDTLVQKTERAWETYSALENGSVREFSENMDKRNKAYKEYHAAQNMLLEAERDFKDMVVSKSLQSNQSVRDCIVMLGAEKMFFNHFNQTKGDAIDFLPEWIKKLREHKTVLHMKVYGLDRYIGPPKNRTKKILKKSAAIAGKGMSR